MQLVSSVAAWCTFCQVNIQIVFSFSLEDNKQMIGQWEADVAQQNNNSERQGDQILKQTRSVSYRNKEKIFSYIVILMKYLI
jgi:thiol:disulfide interchange protein